MFGRRYGDHVGRGEDGPVAQPRAPARPQRPREREHRQGRAAPVDERDLSLAVCDSDEHKNVDDGHRNTHITLYIYGHKVDL